MSIALTSVAEARFQFNLKPNSNLNLNQQQIEKLNRFFSDVETVLPVKVKQTFENVFKDTFNKTRNGQIEVSFKKISSEKHFSAPSCDFSQYMKKESETLSADIQVPERDYSDLNRASLLGDYYSSKITLDFNLLEQILLGSESSVQFNCLHRTGYRTAMASLIHETVRLYDSIAKISESAYFQNLAGWVLSGFIFPQRELLNTDTVNSIDPYENKSPRAKLAVNIEYFLLDHDFKCQKPMMYDFLSSHFQMSANSSCNIKFNIEPKANSNSAFLRQAIDLNPKKLYQINYLIAEKGQALVSRWGHAMFHLVFCPSENSTKEECFSDEAKKNHHVVISFRGNVLENEMDTIKGLTGKYTTEMFFLPLGDVIKEYVTTELRSLKSIPLNLTDEEKARFIYRALEIENSYTGKYYFFSNNCATEALNLLRVAKASDKKLQKEKIMSPIGLQELLRDRHISDESVFSDLTEAFQQGNYYPSPAERYQKGFKKLVDAQVIPSGQYEDYEDYLSRSKVQERTRLLLNIQNGNGDKYDLLNSLQMLENQIRIRLERRYFTFLLSLKGKKQGPYQDPVLLKKIVDNENLNRQMMLSNGDLSHRTNESQLIQIQLQVAGYIEKTLPSLYREYLASQTLIKLITINVEKLFKSSKFKPTYPHENESIYFHFVQNYDRVQVLPYELTERYAQEHRTSKR